MWGVLRLPEQTRQLQQLAARVQAELDLLSDDHLRRLQLRQARPGRAGDGVERAPSRRWSDVMPSAVAGGAILLGCCYDGQ